jgi:Domain of unknown function (DUF4279)
MEKEITFTFQFNIFSLNQFDINKISSFLNMTPTKSWVQGDYIKANFFRKESCWSIVSEEIDTYVFEDSFIKFIEPFFLKCQLINKLYEEFNLLTQVDVIIKIYHGATMPGIHLSSKVIEILSSLKCGIDFDIYDYR